MENYQDAVARGVFVWYNEKGEVISEEERKAIIGTAFERSWQEHREAYEYLAQND